MLDLSDPNTDVEELFKEFKSHIDPQNNITEFDVWYWWNYINLHNSSIGPLLTAWSLAGFIKKREYHLNDLNYEFDFQINLRKD